MKIFTHKSKTSAEQQEVNDKTSNLKPCEHTEKHEHTSMFISSKGASDIFWQQLFNAKK
jgi:hypothetical protein